MSHDIRIKEGRSSVKESKNGKVKTKGLEKWIIRSTREKGQ